MSLLLRPVDKRWPVNLDNPFGQPDPAYTELGYRGHPGTDFKCPIGTPVYAAARGTVLHTGPAGTAGIMVDLQHTFGRTRYLHLSASLVVADLAVEAGDIIGLSGNTGLSAGPHLHLDFYSNSEPMNNGYAGRVDPLLYMEGEMPRTAQQKQIIDVLRVNADVRGEEIRADLSDALEKLATWQEGGEMESIVPLVEIKADVEAALAKLDTLQAEVRAMIVLLEQEFPV